METFGSIGNGYRGTQIVAADPVGGTSLQPRLDTLSQHRLIRGTGYKLSESATASLKALQRRGFVRRR